MPARNTDPRKPRLRWSLLAFAASPTFLVPSAAWAVEPGTWKTSTVGTQFVPALW